MSKHQQCLICRSEKIKPVQGYYEKHELVKCASCGFVFMENIPTAEVLDKHYSKYSYASQGYLSPITIQSYEILLDEFEAYRKSNRILDVGCGRGWFLEQAKKRGWEVYGTEYSHQAIDICEGNGLKMTSGALKTDSFPEGHFDVITSFEVLEHINNPLEEIDHIYRFLRKGGLFYCTTPNFNAYLRYQLKADYNVIGYPEHLSYYTRKTLRKLLKDKGFNVQSVKTTGISITRFKTSKKSKSEKYISKESSDEKLRQQIAQKWYLGYAKSLANFFLSLFGVGMTLKGRGVKF